MPELKEKLKLLNGIKILIVDDDKSVANSIVNILKQFNFECYVSSNLVDARDTIMNIDIDLIITEIDLCNSSGIDFTRFINEQKLSIPTIILSGSEEKVVLEASFNNDTFNFMLKPLNYVELFDIITSINFK